VSRLTLTGALPAWIAHLDDGALVGRFGVPTFERGSAYWRSGSVQSITTGDSGAMVLATVRGSGRSEYQTLLTRHADGSAWGSRCSCPMGSDCKHVVAVVLTARELASAPRRQTSGWEERLAGLVAPSAAVDDRAPLGLLVEAVTRTASRWTPNPKRRLRLRPVTFGRSGKWVRTGAAWRELESSYGPGRFDPAQREALVAIHATYRGRMPGYGWSSATDVHLDELGSAGWRLLSDAVAAGVELVGDPRGTHAVELAGPADVLLDLVRPATDGDAELTAVLRLDGEPDLPLGSAADQVLLVGEPAHGAAVEHDHRLVLAAFAQRLDPALTKLLEGSLPLRIPADEVHRFLDVYYPALRRRVRLESRDVPLPEVHPPRLALDVVFEPAHRTRLRWSFAYGDPDRPTLLAVTRGREAPVVRDVEAETGLLESLDVLDAVEGLRADVGGRMLLVPEPLLQGLATATFVERVLPVLVARDDVLVRVQGEPADYAEATEAPVIRVSATDSTDPGRSDWFDLAVTVTVADQHVPFAPLFRALTRGDGRMLLVSGTWFSLDRPELESLRQLIEEARAIEDRDIEDLQVSVFQAGLWDDLVALGVIESQSDRWRRSVSALTHLADVPPPELPTGLKAQLRPYQVEGFHWLAALWDNGLGGILADDMGLGKTVQTLTVALRALERGGLGPDDGPLLVVAPTSVVGTWADEAARTCPDLRVVTVTETARRSRRALAEVVEGAHVVVTSYALLRIDDEDYRGQRWSGLVLDEAQFVKNHRAKTYQCVRRIDAPFTLAITGTPLENSLMDLWALLSIVAPGLYPDPERFTVAYRKPIESGEAPERLDVLRRRIRPIMLRRTKEQVAGDLPPKIEQTLMVTLNPAHRRVYQTHLQRERARVLGLLDDLQHNRMAVFRSLTLLRQLALDVSLVDEHAGAVRSSKIDALLEHLAEVVAEGHRALVFSQFTGFLALVRARLDAEGIGHVYLDGRTRDRPARIEQFRGGDDPVFLISLKAGGFGLTLTEADYVFVLDPWWNPAAEAQAVDRTHRIGQTRTVMVYRLVAAGTIEEKVVALQQRKRDLFAQVVDGGGAVGGAMTADDVRALLAPDELLAHEAGE
jgi:superfamily II DNA or RNA helicase